MTRFLVLLAIALALAIAMVVKDIRRMRRERDARSLRNSWEAGTVELSNGTHGVEMTAHWQGHATE